ncbi:MAG: cadherin-like domain-containing protein [Aeromicrobium sp.]|uniref:Ig-like domain-containing protein n=1 Tax=Aeromicrobium sp. TaxID=1871063 RepID=UPI0039E5C5E6
MSTPRWRRAANSVLAAAVVAVGLTLTTGTSTSAAPNIYTDRLDIEHQMNEGFGGQFVIANEDVNGNPVDIGNPQDMWDGNSWTTPAGNPWGYDIPTSFTPQVLGTIQPIPEICETEDETVLITITGTFTNLGPASGVWNIGSASIINNNIDYDRNDDSTVDDSDKLVHSQGYGTSGSNYPVGAQVSLALSYEAPLADLQAGALDVALSIELNHNGAKAWEVTDFTPSYDLQCLPEAEPLEQTVLPGDPTTLDLTGLVTTDVVDPDWTTLRLIDENGDLVTTLTTDAGTYTVGEDGTVEFVPDPDFEGGPTPTVSYSVADGNGDVAESTIDLTVARPPVLEPLTETTVTTDTVTFDPIGSGSGQDGSTLDPTSVYLIDSDGNLVRTLTVPGQGTFTVDEETGEITFVAVEGFTGDVSVRYSVADSNGLRSESTLTVSVLSEEEAAQVEEEQQGGILPTTGTGAALALVLISALLGGVGVVVVRAARRRPLA